MELFFICGHYCGYSANIIFDGRHLPKVKNVNICRIKSTIMPTN